MTQDNNRFKISYMRRMGSISLYPAKTNTNTNTNINNLNQIIFNKVRRFPSSLTRISRLPVNMNTNTNNQPNKIISFINNKNKKTNFSSKTVYSLEKKIKSSIINLLKK